MKCDVCGVEVSDFSAVVATCEFAFEGRVHRVNLCAGHRDELRAVLELLKTFVRAGVPLSSSGNRRREVPSHPGTVSSPGCQEGIGGRKAIAPSGHCEGRDA